MEIELTKGYKAIVDSEDFERLNQHKWFALETVTGNKIHVHACRWSEGTYPNRSMIRMHYDVLNATPTPGVLIDHKNRNGIDNRKENLRFADKQMNAQNSDRVINAKGVYYDKARRRWKAFKLTGITSQRQYVGTFKTEEEALGALKQWP